MPSLNTHHSMLEPASANSPLNGMRFNMRAIRRTRNPALTTTTLSVVARRQ
jgi:hypothetical protein